MQQHSSGQPPEKKLRVGGNYTNADPNNYDYQVNLSLFIPFSPSFILEKCQSNPTTATTNVSSTTSLLICSLLYLYMHIYSDYLFPSALIVQYSFVNVFFLCQYQKISKYVCFCRLQNYSFWFFFFFVFFVVGLVIEFHQ